MPGGALPPAKPSNLNRSGGSGCRSAPRQLARHLRAPKLWPTHTF